MTNDANLRLSSTEMELVRNADWLLTKNRIIDKVYHLLGHVAQQVRGDFGPAPKISRGENYQGLPWVMLDYPRQFSKEDVFAVRVFFWWGHFFSITLHVKGDYLQQHKTAILEQLQTLEQHNFHICISNDEWRHEFTIDNYVPVQEVGYTTIQSMLNTAAFCRLSVKIPLEEWDRVEKILVELYDVIFAVTGHQLPRR
jgi:hypothetical protein